MSNIGERQYEEKVSRLDTVYSELADLSNKRLVLETERDRILQSFTEEEVAYREERYWEKVCNEYYESMKGQEW